MSRKKFNNSGIVFSTDPGFRAEEERAENREYLPVGEQPVKVQLDKKQRAGKVVTLIYGLDHSDGDIEQLGKELKRYCDTGGSAKEGEIIIQGDFREKAKQFLLKQGYKKTKII